VAKTEHLRDVAALFDSCLLLAQTTTHSEQGG
jgi:hypothetical protein